MKVTSLIALLVLAAASVFADDVEFTAALDGSGDSGFNVYATSSAEKDKTCTATATVTKKDGSTRS
jgi:hypothetical protein